MADCAHVAAPPLDDSVTDIRHRRAPGQRTLIALNQGKRGPIAKMAHFFNLNPKPLLFYLLALEAATAQKNDCMGQRDRAAGNSHTSHELER